MKRISIILVSICIVSITSASLFLIQKKEKKIVQQTSVKQEIVQTEKTAEPAQEQEPTPTPAPEQTPKSKPAPEAPTPKQATVAKPFLVYLDPGHQAQADTSTEPVGPGATEMKIKVAGGATGVVTKRNEYEIALDAAQILGDILEKKGIQVLYTRTTHHVNISNKQRAEMANAKQANLFVRLHADAADGPNAKGFSVLTPSKNNPYIQNIAPASINASQHILQAVKQDNTIPVRALSYRDDMTGFNWSQVPVTLIEMGFLTNPDEDRKLSDRAYLEKLMERVAEGIVGYADEQ